MTQLAPTELNAVFRLVMVAERCGPEFLYDAERAGQVLGRNGGLDSQVFQEARRLIEGVVNRGRGSV